MGYLKETDFPGLIRKAPLVETPFRLSATPCEFHMRPPTLGEHTDQILRELKYSDADISILRHKQVI
jgi:crotonobetainyl-CoA:carnitine CoA-transferase CaiB-like acyl-CoA transferase